MPTDTLTADAARLARHYADMCGWLHATSITRDERAANEALIDAGFVIPSWRDRAATQEA